MLTYQIRRRVFRHDTGAELKCPADCVLRFHFEPTQSFGTSNAGRTPARDKPAQARFDANTGRYWFESGEPFGPLDVLIEERDPGKDVSDLPDRTIRLQGSTLEIRERFETLSAVEEFVTGIFFSLPALLSVGFNDPQIVIRVDGDIGGSKFGWELRNWNIPVYPRTNDDQERGFATAWNRLPLVSGLGPRRLLAAIHYFHVAVRLDRASASIGEFMAETLLNLAKALEALFPPGTRDAIRSGLRQLGYDDNDIEKLFLPAVALRNGLDVAHASLALFKREQLETIHAYTEVAEGAFRELLDRFMTALAEGKVVIPEYQDASPSKQALETITRLAKHFGPAENGKQSMLPAATYQRGGPQFDAQVASLANSPNTCSDTLLGRSGTAPGDALLPASCES
jgi:hypothetical protein